MSLSYRSQSIDLQSKSVDWFLYDRELRHERVNKKVRKFKRFFIYHAMITGTNIKIECESNF